MKVSAAERVVTMGTPDGSPRSAHWEWSKKPLIPGDKGAFEWMVNGELVYSKHETGRYPELKEIKEAVYALV